MATIRVDSTSMRNKAEIFRTISKNISTYTEELQSEINGMKKVWEGEAAETTVGRFTEFRQAFEEKKQTIENYAAFLENAAEAYDNSDNSVKNSAGKNA